MVVVDDDDYGFFGDCSGLELAAVSWDGMEKSAFLGLCWVGCPNIWLDLASEGSGVG